MTLSKSLYPHCFSIPRDLASAGGGKKSKISVPLVASAKQLVGSRLDFGCQPHHTNEFLQVPRKNVKCAVCIARGPI